MLVREVFARWLEAEQGRFVLLLPVAMGAAILAYFALPSEPPLWLAALLPLLTLAGLALGWRQPYARFLAALALAAALGFARAELRTAAEPPYSPIPTGILSVTGTITQVDLLPGARRITLTAPRLDSAAPLRRAIHLRLRGDDATPFVSGEAIRTYAMLYPPDRPAYPGGWDQQRQDYFANLAATGFTLGSVTVIRTATPGALASALQNLRLHIQQTILATLPPATGAIAVTLLTGDENAIPADEHNAFIAAGLAHILAVAGLHVGIVMGLAFATARFLLTRSERAALHLPVKPIAAALALLAGVAYAGLTGAHLPILRSLTMASLVTLGVIVGRRAISFRGLAIAALVILLATPEAILGVSFQMSFSAVLALIAGYASVQSHLSHLHDSHGRAALHIAGLFTTSLLAGGASMPFAAYQFQQIQPYWIPANILAVPLTALWVMPLGLLALALMPLGLSALALVPMGWGIAVMVWLTRIIAAWPDAMLRIAPIPTAAILLVAAGLIWLCIWRSAARLAGLAFFLAAALIYTSAAPPDVLVSPDARLIAIRAAPSLFLIRPPKASAFTLEQWIPVWGRTQFTSAQCTAKTCSLGPILYAQSPPQDCADAHLAVSPQPLGTACAAIPIIDRVTVYENGATAAWITPGGVRLLTDREVQGARPWVTPYPLQTTLR
ncbi:MAG: hypothetical protein B7X08_05415 [Acidocella sp. 20-63-7]|nr:MAG: hypothetical protein B7X08_05415 [Acidocella sp. 20-63-7]